eukprot:7699470-Pyramimonas_sp.AAC.1
MCPNPSSRTALAKKIPGLTRAVSAHMCLLLFRTPPASRQKTCRQAQLWSAGPCHPVSIALRRPTQSLTAN